ncbi:hypothetical protein [Pantoea eucalypti]|jgi:hypothetical protein|uniref:hypothetical protein n=1 Tax=Pantoea eucalypti TaxID=470933 RepID=UPI00099933D0|nr:hypothetical protein [Pantoea eucalypti]SJZ85148.1 hypothetical protein SAMN03097723_2228 [Pantoea eucalypti]
MSDIHSKLIIIIDDREFTSGEVCSLVGVRSYGEIILKRRPLFEHFRDALPEWAKQRLVRLKNNDDLAALRSTLESCSEDTAACVIAGRAGFPRADLLTQLVERLPYAEEDFTNSLYKPLLVFLHNAHHLVDRWKEFAAAPLHMWSESWQDSQRLQSLQLLDLGKIREFLSFSSGSTATRHFNEVMIDTYYYTKSSSDKRKMQAEYMFYSLVPERMKPWIIQPFNFKDEGGFASYKMLRYYLADSALQWVHGAFEPDTFAPFIERLLFFISDRPMQACPKEQSAALAKNLFVTKLEKRVNEFLTMPEGIRINQLASSTSPEIELSHLTNRYLKLFKRFEKSFSFDYRVVGHGDPCFSNILYDQQRYLLKLIDPKGALSEEELWTHPLYDLCKISHSVMGDYDFINNGLYKVGFEDNNNLVLSFNHTNHLNLKPIFINQVKAMGHDVRIVRLGEASLFLSMLPLHIDYPNKVLAFMLKARQILDEVEGV